MPRTERMVRMQPTTRTKFCRGVDAWLSFTATLTDSIELLQQGGPLRFQSEVILRSTQLRDRSFAIGAASVNQEGLEDEAAQPNAP